MRAIFGRSVLAGVFSVLAAFQVCAAPAENGESESVFQIGTFDRSSGEFAPGNPTGKVNFVVSQSNPAKDWFSVQAAVLGGANKSPEANAAAAPRAITFSLKNSPAAAYRLHVALLIENASVPALKVDINGKSGMFYLHPKLDYSSGDQQDSFNPAYSSADVEFTFPGNYLHSGANTIMLQLVEEAEEAVPDAGINYDAIELATAGSKPDAAQHSAQLVPTVFFQKDGGELKECVEAYVRYAKHAATGGSADLTIAGKRYHRDLRGGHDFGEEKIQFMVSEFAPQSQAQLTWKINGRQESWKQSIDPKKKWTVYVVPEIHVDIGFSDYQAKVSAVQSRTIDEAMKMTADHPDFRFSLDGYWDLQQFFNSRTDAQKQRAIEAIQKKQLFIPAQHTSLLTGLPTTETLIRSLYPSANFARKYGTPLDYANITDVPSYTWSYASVLASAGIPYFAAGSDNYRAPALLQGRLNENSPAYWEGPDGKKVLLWYSRHYMQMQILFGLPPVIPAGHDTLPLMLQMYERPNYRADSTIMFGTQVENTDLFPQQAELAQKWNTVYAYPHFQYSGFSEALATIEKQAGDSIPTIRGDGGPYWEDGAGSDAYYVSMERRNEARGQTAEKLATLAALTNPVIKSDTAELSQMWTNMVLMDEHTWDSYNSTTAPASHEAVDQLAMKDQLAVNAAAQVDFVTKRSMENLADVIPAGTGSAIIFNSLNWKRSSAVIMDLDKNQELVDVATKQPVPVEILVSGANFKRVRFLATDVPALGYRVYATRVEQKEQATPKAEQSTTLESQYYKVELDAETGAVRSIFDKQLQRELVSQESPYRFGEYLYVTGGDKGPNTILHYDHVSPKPELEVHPAGKGKVVSVVQTPTGQVAHLESQALNTPSIKTEIRLFDNEKKIEIVQDVDKTEVLTKEAVYFAFPFDMKQPQFQYEIQNGVVDPAKDMYPGAGHEWFTAQHWVSVQQDGTSATVMPLDAPLITLGDINRGAWPEEFGKRPGTVFSYAMNNYWDTNYRAGQGGHFSFHYVITSAGATDQAGLSRLGWEAVTPLEWDIITTQDKALGVPGASQAGNPAQPSAEAGTSSSQRLGGDQGSFLDVQDPNLLLETWKPAEDGNGTIMRFVDLGGAERTVTVRTPFLHLGQVSQTDAVERGQTAVPVDGCDQFHFTIHPHEIVTVRVVEGNK